MIVWFQCTVSRYPAVLSMIGRLLHKSLQACGHQPQWQKRKINRGAAKEYLEPAVLDLINQLMLCAPTCPASKLQRHSLEALPRRKDRARASITFAAPSTHRARSRNHRQASIRRGAGATGAEAVQRPASLHHPWLLISCRLLLCMRAVCTTTTGTSRSPCA